MFLLPPPSQCSSVHFIYKILKKKSWFFFLCGLSDCPCCCITVYVNNAFLLRNFKRSYYNHFGNYLLFVYKAVWGARVSFDTPCQKISISCFSLKTEVSMRTCFQGYKVWKQWIRAVFFILTERLWVFFIHLYLNIIKFHDSIILRKNP